MNPVPTLPVPTLIDRQALALTRNRAIGSGGDHFLLGEIARDMGERIDAVTRSFDRLLEIAPRPGLLGAPLIANGKAGAAIYGLAGSAPRSACGPATMIDEEWLPFTPDTFDLVGCVLTLHAVNDLPGALIQIRDVLKPDGLFVASLFGGGTLAELRHAFAEAEAEVTGGAAPRVMPFTEVREAGDLLRRAGFALPVADIDRLVVRYPDPLALMHDLRAMGETNVLTERSRRPLPRDVLTRMIEIYAERFSDLDGRVRATFEIITMTGWRPAPNQQQPLAPGSAKTRLADFLGTREIPAGDSADPNRRPKGD